MADRKHSPDVLAELLGTELPSSQLSGLPTKTTTPRTSKAQPATKSRAKRPLPKVSEPPAITWETEIVTFQDHRGWRPRYVNGTELQNWLAGPLMHDYLRERNSEGWELAAVSSATRFYGVADGLQMYLKRRT